MKLGGLLAAVLLAAPFEALAAPAAPTPSETSTPPSPQTFVLIVGANRSFDTALAPLRYADDDAVRFADLFRALGARIEVLARLDENTRRVHPEAATLAQPPTLPALRKAAGRLAREVAAARRQGRRTALLFLFAGHGNVANDEGYITLEDARLYSSDLSREILDRVAADESHFVIDACHSFLVARSRGPGGARREVRGFSEATPLVARPEVGLLLSTSAARESHEWEAFQAGVFSHEVRSGLHGAADLNGDGVVSYREIGAFVERANASIPNERFRPRIYARPPRGRERLIDLRPGLARRLVVPADRQAHFVLEDTRGVRLAEFHKAAGSPLQLLRPASAGLLYLSRHGVGEEYAIAAEPTVVDLADVAPEAPRAATRGAAHHAFTQLFTLPFDAAAVQSFEVAVDAPADPGPEAPRWPRLVRLGAFVTAGAALGTGLALTWSAHSLRQATGADLSQQDVDARNQQIRLRNKLSVVSYGVAAASLLTGLLLFVGPDDEPPVSVTLTEREAWLGLGRRF